MSNQRWMPGPFRPREATCSDKGELHPSSGGPIKSMSYPTHPDPIAAEIREFPSGTPTMISDQSKSRYHWERCEGQLLGIAEYQNVFSSIGVTYGGDGRSTFGLPNLRASGDYYICLNGELQEFAGP